MDQPAGPLPNFQNSDDPPATCARLGRTARRGLGCLTLLVVGLAVGRLAGIQGWVKPVRVAGSSMAETLLGDHLRIVCEDCGFTFRCGLEATFIPEFVTCPNCGFTRHLPAHHTQVPGQRVWIDRLAFVTRTPQRGELVALHDPLDPKSLAVKRVVGLPGERISIRRGDVYVDDRRWQKSLAQLREVALLVHDDHYRPQPASQVPDRWREEGAWSVYHHWRCFANPLPRTDDSPVLDNDTYNQGHSRTLREVPDQLLVGRLYLARNEQVVVRLITVDGPVDVMVDAVTAQVSVRRPGDRQAAPESSRDADVVRATDVPPGTVGHWSTLEIATCDGQLLVAINGRLLLQVQESSPHLRCALTSPTPWAVGCVGRKSRLVERRIFRDIYYVDPDDVWTNWTSERSQRANEYFLLGDNPPVSVDSRRWPDGGATPAEQIVGRVLRGSRLP